MVDGRRIEWSLERCDNRASGIDEDGHRRRDHAVRLVVTVDDLADWVRVWMPLLEGMQGARGVLHGGTDEGYPGVGIGSARKNWQVLRAAHAPRRPEIQDHRFAA